MGMLSFFNLQAAMLSPLLPFLGVSVLFSPFILGWTADRVGIQAAYAIIPFILVSAVILTYLINRFIQRT